MLLEKGSPARGGRFAVPGFVPVGCELEFKLLLAVDTNHGSVFPDYNRLGERPYDR